MSSTRRSWVRRIALPLAVFLTSAVALELDALAVTPATTRVSLTSGDTEANGDSYDSSISAEGRLVAFASTASNLVAGDTNGLADIFLRDRKTGTTKRISVSSAGAESNGESEWPSISADGRSAAFESEASNLVGADTNGVKDVFVRDRGAGTTRRISVSSNGTEGNGDSLWASTSADGRFVAFMSQASNLVAGDTNGAYDIFIRDRSTGTTRRVSVSSDGTEGNGGSYAPAISADGRFVSFSADASNLVGGDTNAATDVFVRDRETGRTRRVSLSSGGAEGDDDSDTPTISASGRFVTFGSGATNLVGGDTNATDDIFVRDRRTGRTTRVSVNSDGLQANSISYAPWISADGRFVAFLSYASNLAYGDTNGFADIFLHDRETGTTRRLSLNSAGTIQANGDSSRPIISADGRFVSFESAASDLVADDTNGSLDVFVRGPML